jgi:hypothetical protein
VYGVELRKLSGDLRRRADIRGRSIGDEREQ